MKPLDSPFQSRKDRDSLEKDEDEPVEGDLHSKYSSQSKPS